jgi:hypothetical protein
MAEICIVQARIAQDPGVSEGIRDWLARNCTCLIHLKVQCSAMIVADLTESTRRSVDKLRKRHAFCFYCGARFEHGADGFRDLLVPRPLGRDEPRNRVRACERCADRKANRTVEEFRILLENCIFYGESSGICPRDPVIPCSACGAPTRSTVHVMPIHGISCEISAFPREIMARATVNSHVTHAVSCSSRFEITVRDE